MARWLAWGAAAGAAYLGAALWTWGTGTPPARALFDGVAPLPPYHWVRPPAGVGRDNQPPDGGAGSVILTADGSQIGAVTTGDDQAAIVFPREAVALRQGETAIRVTLTPLDPATVAPAPAGLVFDGNAYRIEAVYGRSGAPAIFRKKVTIVLRFPVTGTKILLARGGLGWTELVTTTIPPALQDVADSDALGVFVTAGPITHGLSLSTILYRVFSILLWGAAVVLFAGVVRDYIRQRRR